MGLISIYSLSALGATMLGLIVTPLVMRQSRILGLLDMPGARKVHRTPIPRLGGLAIALAVIVPFAVAAYVLRHELFPEPGSAGPVLTLLSAATCVLVMGVIDDLGSVRAQYKLLVIVFAAVVFCGSGGLIRSVVYNGEPVLLFGSLAWPITILWMVGITVSVNFIDGLDGLAAGIVAIAGGVLVVGAAVGGHLQFPSILLAICLTAALVGFLVFNFNPAKIFMGDCGSMFIGFTLAGCCVLASRRMGTCRSLTLPGLALAIPVCDTVLTFLRRGILQRRSLFAAEKGHIHHRLLNVGLCHRHAVLVLYGVTLGGAGLALISIFGSPWAVGVAAGGYCVLLIGLFRISGSVRARETFGAIRRNRAIGRETRRYQSAFEELEVGFRDVVTFDAWWQQVCKTAELLDFAKMNLPLTRRDGTSTMLRWRRSTEELADCDSITAEVPIPQRRVGQTLRLELEVLASKFLENSGQRIALFSRLMGEFGLAHLPEAVRPAPEGAFVASQESEESKAVAPHNAGTLSNLRVAIVHDFLYTYAGAERVLEQLIALFPQAELFSLFDFLPENLRGFIRGKTVRSTFLQKLPWARRNHRVYLPLMPLAIEQLDLTGYDIVVSSSYLVAKGVITRPDQLHISYCHTPARFAWDLQNQYLDRRGLVHGIKSIIARLILHYVRNWDVRSSNGVDIFVTNSDFVGRRINKIYRRSAATIYPPVNTDWFVPNGEKEDFYFTVSRLVAYKRIDLIIQAFNQMPTRRLIVAGDGPEFEALRAMAGPNIRVLGYQPAERLRQYMQRARGFVFAAEEDFGIVPVEAQACGTPVIAFGRGGVLESVIPGQTGLFFNEQSVESVVHTVGEFESRQWDSQLIRRNAERFSIQQFRDQFWELTKKNWAAFLAERIDSSRKTSESAMASLAAWPTSRDLPANADADQLADLRPMPLQEPNLS